LSCEDFEFLDHWAHRRFGQPLPAKSEDEASEEAEPWEPPPAAPTTAPELDDFRRHLAQKHKTAARAWRLVMDLKGHGALTMSDFGKGCRAAGWHHPHQPLYRQLAQAGGGYATMRGLDPDTARAIDKANEMLTARFGDAAALWAKALDDDGSGAISRAEFLGHRKMLGLTPAEARLLFDILDTAGSGWLTEAELGFLEAFESRLPALLSSLPVEASSPAVSTASGLSRSLTHLSSPGKSTRSFQARAYASTHQIKHLWLRDRAKHEIEKLIL